MTLTISIISLILSGLTFWLTRLKAGVLKMTRPSLICFLGQNGNDKPKIFLRTLLYSTADQGQYIQNMFVKISNEGTIQNFNIWAYGDAGLVRGSGLFISKTGVSVNHHFLLPKNEHWSFVAGNYQLEVYAESIDGSIRKLFEQNLVLTSEQSTDLKGEKAIYYDWVPNTGQYLSYTETSQRDQIR